MSDFPSRQRWYQGVTRYQWFVLAIASVGWVFDAFEGQVYIITRSHMLPDILRAAPDAAVVRQWGEHFLSIFLAGGAFGGILFGSLADRWGRKPIMVTTILFYSIFAGLTYFATTAWEIGVLRFFVAMGVGGEWAVAAALVAEVFPKHSRAQASGFFHATSIIGTWVAALVGLAVGAHWRYAYLISVLPAILVLWVWSKVKEPESWTHARQKAATGEGGKLGSFRELFSHRVWRPRVLLGTVLAAVGLGTFWSVLMAGQDLAKEMLLRGGVPADVAIEKAKFAYGIVQAVGAGLGMFCFGPLAARLGRRRTFVLYQVCALVIIPVTCYLPPNYTVLLALLPFYGFFVIGIHAGFAVYFPELFPHHLRSTGAGFCFNGGRLLAASVLVFSGWLKGRPGMDLRFAVTLLGLLFLVGIVTIAFLPETKDQPLPE